MIKSHDEYLSNSDTEVISFDEVKTSYCRKFFKSDTALNSVDAILMKDNHIIFIEFKNGEVKTHNVKSKLKDSILICCDKLDVKVKYFR